LVIKTNKAKQIPLKSICRKSKIDAKYLYTKDYKNIYRWRQKKQSQSPNAAPAGRINFLLFFLTRGAVMPIKTSDSFAAAL
jgi:hypothetical protein